MDAIKAVLIEVVSIGFNPRARDGRDDHRQSIAKAPQRFNPRARDGRDSRGILFDVHSMFQSTRP